MNVITGRPGLVVVFLTAQMHQVEFVHQAMLLEQLQGSIYGGAVDVRIAPACLLEQVNSIQVNRGFLNGLDQRLTLRGNAYAPAA